MHTILVADDEPRIRTLVGDFLKKSGYAVLEAEDGGAALKLLQDKSSGIELAILDVMMPEIDGWEVCRRLRGFSGIPVLMLTARSEEFDELTGFEAGADDYVTKPFSPNVLVKRVDALLRRGSGGPAGAAAQGDGLRIDKDAYSAVMDGKPLDLTLKEYEILQHLLENKGRVFTREQLLNAIWGYEYDGDSRTVDSHVARLRTKLGEWGVTHLRTVYGLGYKIEVGS